MFKKRIEQAYKDREFLKLLFRFPDSQKTTIKKGIVIGVGDDGFEFEEIYDGKTVYSYRYLIQISGERNVT